MFNIATLAVAATAAIHLKNAAGEPLYDGEKPMRIVVHSPGSRAFATVDSRQTARQTKRMNDNDGKITAPTSEERRAETAEDLATITIAFENFNLGDDTLQGEALFKAVYSDPSLGFITRQVTKFIGDWANFKAESVES